MVVAKVADERNDGGKESRGASGAGHVSPFHEGVAAGSSSAERGVATEHAVVGHGAEDQPGNNEDAGEVHKAGGLVAPRVNVN